ncbi:MAG: alpha/beta hydrolase [Acidobacteria bacterium]|nr:alpha/beta hydrolase [Acidobacteriota bacterium]
MELKIYWAVAAVFCISAVVVLIVGWIGCERGIHPEPTPEEYDLSQFDLPRPEDVHFESRDGLRLAGWFLPGTNGATVILTHGRGGNRTWMLPHADYLHRNGFSVLLFDFRFHGKSEGDVHTLGAKEPWDVEAAVDYLKARPDVDTERIGVQGNSLGAVAAIFAAAERPELKGVIADVPFKSLSSVIDHSFRRLVGLPSFPFAPVSKFFWELRLGINMEDVEPVKVIGKISPRPVFLIDDLEDDPLPSDSVEAVYQAAREPKELWQIPECSPHGKGWECKGEEYERRVLAFWRKTFGIAQP